MAELKAYKLTSLPGGTLEANALYFILNGGYAESYLTDSSGVAKAVGNTAMIEAIAGIGTGSVIQIVADITARDALTLTSNVFVLVLDAAADATVDSGAALYIYDSVGEDFIKVAEYESMDVVVTWANISGKPSSSAAAIDSAVTNSHTHSNKSVLDDIDASGGALRYQGSPIDTKTTNWNTVNW